jgi:broad specificity phosphatase PhoE
MSTIYMVRHGQASFGKENYDRLSPKGSKQSRLLADFFLRTGLTFDALYSGAIDRQRQTVREIISLYDESGQGMPEPKVMTEFDEYDSKAIVTAEIDGLITEDQTIARDLNHMYTDKKAFQRVFEKVMLRWVTGLYDKPGVETWAEVQRRVRAGFARVMEENGRNKLILVIASGGTISAAVQFALGISNVETIQLSWQIVNTSVTRFMYNNQRITLQSFNAFSHLELSKQSDLITYR